MKKLVALALAVALFVCVYGPAFADTLTLPAMTAVIEEEAYSYNPALDEVKIPWGAERIESRAFAHSGLKTICIPSSVTDIADDAFEGTNVTIRAAADSYAREYADAHGIAWEDSGSAEAWEISDTFEVLRRDTSTDGHSELFQPLTGEGVTDPEVRAAIDGYNAAVDNANSAIAEYNRRLDALGAAAQDAESLLNGFSASESGDSTSFAMGDLRLTSDASLEDFYGATVTEIEPMSGGTFRLTTDAGANLYMAVSAGEVSLSRKPIAGSNGLAQANGGLEDVWDRVMGWLDQINDYFNMISTWFGSVETELNLAIANIDLAVQDVFDKIRPIMRMPRGQKMQDIDWHILDAADVLLKELKGKKARLEGFKAVLRRFSVGGNIANILIIQGNMRQLKKDILSHGHPNENDVSDSALATADLMNAKIESLIWLYLCDSLSSALSLATDLTSWVCAVTAVATVAAPPSAAVLAGAAAALRIANFASALIGLAVNAKQNSLDREIKALDAQLHTSVYGIVKDKVTGEPIAGVEVTDGLSKVYTDGEGRYEMTLLAEATTLVFTMEEYKKNGIVVMPVSGKRTEVQDMELEPEGIPIDEEHFPDEAFRDAVATRDLNENQYLSEKEREGGMLVVNGAASLEGIGYFPTLENLTINQGAVAALDLHGFESLRCLSCPYGSLGYLDVSDCVSLQTLHVQNNQLSYLNVSGCPAIESIYFDNNPLFGTLDLSACHRLRDYKTDPRSEYHYHEEGENNWVLDYKAFGTYLSAVIISRQSPAYSPVYERLVKDENGNWYEGIIVIR